jgi:hypothetical protein
MRPRTPLSKPDGQDFASPPRRARAAASKKLPNELRDLLIETLRRLRGLAVQTRSPEVARVLVVQHALVVAVNSDPKGFAAIYTRAEAILKRHGQQSLVPAHRPTRTAVKVDFIRTVGRILKTVHAPLAAHTRRNPCNPKTCPAPAAAFQLLTEALHDDGWQAVAGRPSEGAEDAIAEVLHDLDGSEDDETVAKRVARAAYDRSTANLWKFLDMATMERSKAKLSAKSDRPSPKT